jgi:hypothetical protein
MPCAFTIYFVAKVKEKTMANKKFWLGISVMALVFGVCVVGCVSFAPAYYNLGNVSEENCAIVDVLSGSVGSKSNYSVSTFVNIDGQGNYQKWRENPLSSIGGRSEAFVRVTPGRHTFLMHFIFEEKEIPVSITYDCRAGMGYNFSLAAKNRDVDVIDATITIFENTINENGKFGGIYSGLSGIRIAGEKTETFHKTALRK